MRIEELICVADTGDPAAAFALGFYWEQSGCLAEAERRYRTAAMSLPIAAAALASLLAVGPGPRHSSGARRQEAIKFAELAAEHNIGAGYYILGELSLRSDQDVAFKHFQAAHELGSDAALIAIGMMRTDIESSKFDIDEAERILDLVRKADRIVPYSLISIIHLLRDRKGEAISALRQGIENGDAESMRTLAMYYSLGMFGVERNKDLAAQLDKEADSAFRL